MNYWVINFYVSWNNLAAPLIADLLQQLPREFLTLLASVFRTASVAPITPHLNFIFHSHYNIINNFEGRISLRKRTLSHLYAVAFHTCTFSPRYKVSRALQ